MPGEVITLQLGSFANYVGAHYWNIQDELVGLAEAEEGGPAAQVDPSVLWRAGETLAGEATYTPRLVLWDLAGALGGVSAGGALYREPSGGGGAGVVASWAGGHEVHAAAPVPKSRFALELEAEPEWAPGQEEEAAADAASAAALAAAAAQLDSGTGGGGGGGGGGVRYFTDYLKAHLHPRSVHQLSGAWHGLTPFGGWGDGGEHWRSEEQREAAMERIRFFAEEADHLQGFQCWADDLTGFGQLAAHVLQEVRDEYGPSRPVMLYALRPDAAAANAAAGSPAAAAVADDPAELRRRRLNEGLSLSLLVPLCSTFTVLAPPAAHAGLPLLRWQPGSAFHASALCGAALDTATLPYRLAHGAGPRAAIGAASLWDLSQLLAGQHRSPLAALAAALPCAPLPADLQHAAQQADARFAQLSIGGGGGGGTGPSSEPFTTQWLASLTPGIAAAGDVARYAESIVLRGPRAGGQPVELGVAAEALDAALAAERLRCVRQRSLSAQPLPLPLPFPRIFAGGLSRAGDPPAGSAALAAALRGGGGGQEAASAPMLTRLSGTAAFAPLVAAAQRQFAAAAGSAQGQATLEAWGHGREELGGLQERLTRLVHAYDEGEE